MTTMAVSDRRLHRRGSVYGKRTSRRQCPPALCGAPAQNYPLVGVTIRSL